MKIFLLRILCCLTLIIYTGCNVDGGSSKDDGATGGNSKKKVSGVLCTGAPLADAEVFLKDTNGKLEITKTDKSGNYKLETSLEFPLIIVGTKGNKTLYSQANQEGVNNITPATNMIFAMALGNDPSGIYPLDKIKDSSKISVVDKDKLTNSKNDFNDILKSFYKKQGIDTNFDPLTSEFKADHSGFDQLLDILKLDVTTNGTVNIEYNGQSLYSLDVSDPDATPVNNITDDIINNLDLTAPELSCKEPFILGNTVTLYPSAVDESGISGFEGFIISEDGKIEQLEYSDSAKYFYKDNLKKGKYDFTITAFDNVGNSVSLTLGFEIKTDSGPLPIMVNFYKNDGTDLSYSGGAYNVADFYLDNFDFDPEVISREGYILKGWAKTPDGELVYQIDDLHPVSETDVNLYAVWEATVTPEVTITFINNDPYSTGGVPADITVNSGENVTIPDSGLMKNGWTLSWNTLSTGNGTSYQTGTGFIDTSASYTLYAIWTPPVNWGLANIGPGGGRVFLYNGNTYEVTKSRVNMTPKEYALRNDTIGSVYQENGNPNTNKIYEKYNGADIASTYCYFHKTEINGVLYDDWYLPAIKELIALSSLEDYIPELKSGKFWSSTETNTTTAKMYNFLTNTTYNYPKSDKYAFWAIRKIQN